MKQLNMQTKLAKLSDSIFKYLIFFTISFIWCTTKTHNIKICAIVSIIISAILCFISTKIFYIKQNKKTLKLNEENLIKNISTQLKFYTTPELINYFYNVISFSNPNTTKTKQHILVNGHTHVVPVFNTNLTAEDYFKIFKIYKNKQCIILTNTLSPNLNELLSQLEPNNIKILTINDVYFKLIKPTSIMPTNTVKQKSVEKIKFKKLLEIALNKRNSKKYFLYGVLLMFLSFIYKHTIYYQIMGTILMLLSLFAHFNKRFNLEHETNLFEIEKNTE